MVAAPWASSRILSHSKATASTGTDPSTTRWRRSWRASMDRERPPLGPAGQHQRGQEVVLVLPADPALVQLLQWGQEPGGGELGHPDRVEHPRSGPSPSATAW